MELEVVRAILKWVVLGVEFNATALRSQHQTLYRLLQTCEQVHVELLASLG